MHQCGHLCIRARVNHCHGNGQARRVHGWGGIARDWMTSRRRTINLLPLPRFPCLVCGHIMNWHWNILLSLSVGERQYIIHMKSAIGSVRGGVICWRRTWVKYNGELTLALTFAPYRTKMRWHKIKIWYDNEVRWIRITVWNGGDLSCLKKLNKLMSTYS